MAPEHFFFLLTAFAFVFGAVVGSFLNVVIYRVPAGLSVVHPGSRCPTCRDTIRWYDNIPILSWFALGGECRTCATDISPRYALIEALMGFLSALLFIKIAAPHFRVAAHTSIPTLPPPSADITMIPWGSLALAFGLYFFFLAILLVITFVDLDHCLIPHEFTLPAMAVGVLAAFLLNSDRIMADGSLAGFWPPVTLINSLIGMFVGGFLVILIFYAYFAARGAQGIGGGDVTLMAVMGAWLGWPALLFIFFAASIQGIIAAAIGALMGSDFIRDSREILADGDPRATDEILELDDLNLDESSEDESSEMADEPPGRMAVPFGPFIALAGVQYFFIGEFLPTYLSLSYLYLGF